MGIELQFLNLIQEIRTTFLDVFMSNVTKLGNVGFIWILLTIILLVIPKTRKSGVILAAALIVDLILCNVILKPLVARIRPFDVNTAIQLIYCKATGLFFSIRAYCRICCIGSGALFSGGEETVEDCAYFSLFYCIFQNVFICSLSNRCFRWSCCGSNFRLYRV